MFNQMRVTPASYAASLADGTGANQAQIAWSDSYSWDDGSTTGYIIAGLADDRGTVSFSSLKVLYIKNNGGDPLLVYSSNFASGPIKNSGRIEVQGGGVAVLVAPTSGGWTASGNSSLVVDRQSGTNANFDIVLIGEGTIS
jgi:hypothetical protein